MYHDGTLLNAIVEKFSYGFNASHVTLILVLLTARCNQQFYTDEVIM